MSRARDNANLSPTIADARMPNLTGDVTTVEGAVATTIATDAVDIAMLSATGTANGTTFLRGDNAWAAAGGGKVLQIVATSTPATGDADPVGNTVSSSLTTVSAYVTAVSHSITVSDATNKVLAIAIVRGEITADSGSGICYGGTRMVSSGDDLTAETASFGPLEAVSGEPSNVFGFAFEMIGQTRFSFADTRMFLFSPAFSSSNREITVTLSGRTYDTGSTLLFNRYMAASGAKNSQSQMTLIEIDA